jgi:hypothetical protein
MTERVCRKCDKILNGRKFLVDGQYHRNCPDCRRKEYQAKYQKEVRAQAKRDAAYIALEYQRRAAEEARQRTRQSQDNQVRLEHLLRRIHGEETRQNRAQYKILLRKTIVTPRTEQAIKGRKGLLDRYDEALERQLDMLQQGYAVSAIPHIRNMVNDQKMQELKTDPSLPAHLLSSMDVEWTPT